MFPTPRRLVRFAFAVCALMMAIADAQPFSLPQDAGARKDLLNLDLKFDAFAAPIPPCREKR